MIHTANIGLFGLGTVGSGFMEVLPDSGLLLSVKKVCVKTPGKPRKIAAERLTFQPADILDDPEIGVVVETTTAVKEAFDIVQSAMRNGKHVVTANKKMLAHYFPQLLQLQAETGCALLYEGAACGAIPIVRTLDEHFGVEPLQSLSGIFNGTSNYILTRMIREKLDFNTALIAAQTNGFAELDPSSDIDGFDAKYKLILLAAHSFGYFATPESVLNLGIRFIRREDLDYALQQNQTIKLLPVCRPGEQGDYLLYVLPAFVAADDLLFHIHEEFNGVKVNGAYSGQQFFKGRGAGSRPTGSAILADLTALQRGFRYQYHKFRQNGRVAADELAPLEVYCSLPADVDPGPLALQQPRLCWRQQAAHAFSGTTTLRQLKKCSNWIRQQRVFIATSHPAR